MENVIIEDKKNTDFDLLHKQRKIKRTRKKASKKAQQKQNIADHNYTHLNLMT